MDLFLLAFVVVIVSFLSRIFVFLFFGRLVFFFDQFSIVLGLTFLYRWFSIAIAIISLTILNSSLLTIILLLLLFFLSSFLFELPPFGLELLADLGALIEIVTILLVDLSPLCHELQRQQCLRQDLLGFQDVLLEQQGRFSVHQSGNVQRQVEQARINHLDQVGDLKVAVVVKRQPVHQLDDDVLVLVHLFGHFKLHGHVGEDEQEADGHLLGELLVLLHEQKSHDHED